MEHFFISLETTGAIDLLCSSGTIEGTEYKFKQSKVLTMEKQTKFVKLSNIGLDNLELYTKKETGYLDNVCYLYTGTNSSNTYVAMNSTKKVLDFYRFHSSMDKDKIMETIMGIFSDDEVTDFKKSFEAVKEFTLTDNVVVEMPFGDSIFKI